MNFLYILIAVVAVFVVYSLLTTKRRLGARMRNLLNAAKVTVFTMQEPRIRSTSGAEGNPTSTTGLMAAAATNFLFGEEEKAAHAELDLKIYTPVLSPGFVENHSSSS